MFRASTIQLENLTPTDRPRPSNKRKTRGLSVHEAGQALTSTFLHQTQPCPGTGVRGLKGPRGSKQAEQPHTTVPQRVHFRWNQQDSCWPGCGGRCTRNHRRRPPPKHLSRGSRHCLGRHAPRPPSEVPSSPENAALKNEFSRFFCLLEFQDFFIFSLAV
jgi:hypothetical protein